MRKDRLGLQSLAGSVLLAHPNLDDPNFARSVVLISAHMEESGVMGVIINRPLDKTLTELSEELPSPEFAHVPVYEGGPVHREQIILSGWKWLPQDNMFKLYFGLTMQRALEMSNEGNVDIRAFSGYSGWDPGQLEKEIKEGVWVVSSLQGRPMDDVQGGEDLWRSLLVSAVPEMAIILDEPEDPARN